MGYCPKCGNTGIRWDDRTPCDCTQPTDTFFTDLVGLALPDQYLGVRFAPQLVPSDCGDRYVRVLEDLHTQICNLQLTNQNILICSPPAHSKTIWAYSCLQNLFRKRAAVSPVYDVLEMRRMLHDHDMGKENHSDFYEVKYLFLRVPVEVNFTVRATMATILDRRVRRGLSTIFLYNGTWATLTHTDEAGILKGLQGDGSYTSMKVYSFWRT